MTPYAIFMFFIVALFFSNSLQGESLSLAHTTSGLTLTASLDSNITLDSYKDYTTPTRQQCMLLGLKDNIGTLVYEQSTQQCHLYQMTKVQMRTHLQPENGIDVFSVFFENDWRRTVVFLFIKTKSGQNIFVIGGVHPNHRQGCSEVSTAVDDPCAIPIRHDQLTDGQSDTYNAWKEGDVYLDAHKAESGQGSFLSESAGGTPLRWSTNDKLNNLHHPLNTCGEHCWVLDVTMDCAESDEGWFEIRGNKQISGKKNMELLDQQDTTCAGTAGLTTPYTARNRHIAACGYINQFTWEEPLCTIDVF